MVYEVFYFVFFILYMLDTRCTSRREEIKTYISFKASLFLPFDQMR